MGWGGEWGGEEWAGEWGGEEWGVCLYVRTCVHAYCAHGIAHTYMYIAYGVVVHLWGGSVSRQTSSQLASQPELTGHV